MEAPWNNYPQGYPQGPPVYQYPQGPQTAWPQPPPHSSYPSPYQQQYPPPTASQHHSLAAPPSVMYFDSNTEIFCDNCRQHIGPGIQWHCASPSCAGGDFDLCDPCHIKGANCQCHVGLFGLRVIHGRGRERTVLPPKPVGAAGSPYASVPTPATAQPPPQTPPGQYALGPQVSPFTPPYSPPTTHPGMPNPYPASPVGMQPPLPPLPPAPTATTKPLGDLLPATINLKVPTDNPVFKEANLKYEEYIKSTDIHTNPQYDTNTCSTPQQYDMWLEKTHNPQETSFEKSVTSLNSLIKELTLYLNNETLTGPKTGPKAGLDSWAKTAWATKDGEFCDVMDFMDRVLSKLDEIRSHQARAKEVMDRNFVGSRMASTADEIQRLNMMFVQKTLETRGNAARDKHQRRKDQLALVKKSMDRAEAKEKTAFEDILASACSALNVGGGIKDVDLLSRSIEVMSVHVERRKALQVRLCNATLHEAEADKGWRLTQIIDKSQEPALIDEANRKMWEAQRVRDEVIGRLSQDWQTRVNLVIVPHVRSMQAGAAAAQGIAPLISMNSILPPTSGAAASFYTMAPPPPPGPAGGYGQMPYY
ncbi:hypothetical protein TWF694_009365 [Orbilia ellipsospora]|uniref:Uncharacterized protein n=1 Tax=Orbilia ellipsospora TaxID=2528407 RepID=A0AAV9XFC4_9PEZI